MNIKNTFRKLKIRAGIMSNHWAYYELGRLCLSEDEPFKAARYFMKAGRKMANKGYRSLAESALREAKEIYQKRHKGISIKMRWTIHRNLGFIDAFFEREEIWRNECVMMRARI